MKSKTGQILDIAGVDFLSDPDTTYARARAAGPVVRVRDPSGLEYWMIIGYREARAALRDHRLSNDPRHAGYEDAGAGGVFLPMVNSDPPDHTRLRRLVSAAFTARRTEALRPRIQEITDGLLDQLAPDTTVDLIETLTFPLPVLVICELLGIPHTDQDAFLTWTARIFGVDGGPLPGPVKSRRIRAYFARLLENKRAELRTADPADAQPDLLSALLAARDRDNRLTEHEMISICVVLLVAGVETTTNLVSNGVLTLLRHPEQLVMLRERPALLPAAVEEILRHEGSAGQAAIRIAAQDLTIAGITIRAGDMVSIGLAAANRDPARFGEPDRLDITRADNPHLAFGHGVHYCLGAPLARLQGQIAIGSLLHRFPDLTLACPPEDLRWRLVSVLHRLDHLPLVLRTEAARPGGR